MPTLLSPLLRFSLLIPLLAFTLASPLDPPVRTPSKAQTQSLPPAPVQIEVFATGMGMVTDFAFAPDGRLFFTDSNRKAVGILDGEGNLLERIRIPGLSGRDSQVLGLALDPDFVQNGTFYVHYLESDGWTNRVVRFDHLNGQTSDATILLDLPLPEDPANPGQPCTDHNGGHITIAPDGSLFVPMGDNCRQDLVQDLTVAQGKVLRISRATGDGLPGNPFYDDESSNDSRIWAWGVRNPFGSTLDPVTGALWLADNGPGCNDEINLVQPGGNYGWPVSSPTYTECVDPGPSYLAPSWHWDVTIGLTGLTAYDGDAIPIWQHSLLTCDWNTGQLRVLQLDAARTGIISETAVDLAPAACKLDIETGPDGALYVDNMTTIYRLRAHSIRLPLIFHTAAIETSAAQP